MEINGKVNFRKLCHSILISLSKKIAKIC